MSRNRKQKVIPPSPAPEKFLLERVRKATRNFIENEGFRGVFRKIMRGQRKKKFNERYCFNQFLEDVLNGKRKAVEIKGFDLEREDIVVLESFTRIWKSYRKDELLEPIYKACAESISRLQKISA